MIIPGQTIRKLGIFDPFHERTLENGMTFGLGPAGYDVRIREAVFLRPGDFTLASTVEHFAMPADIIGVVHDKSTWARRGLACQNTIIECGWQGYLTLELTNHGPNNIQIPEGSPIAQIILHRLEEPSEAPYAGKYQHQPARPVAAIDEQALLHKINRAVNAIIEKAKSE